jgi:PAS domain S-box-containing protein
MPLTILKFRRLPLAAILLCSLVIVLLWSALLYDLRRSKDAAIDQAQRDVGNLAIAYRENILRTVSAIDQLLIALAAEHADNDYRIPDWIGKSPLLQGLAQQVALIGSDGIIRQSTLGVSGRVDVSDRPHIRHHFDASASQPYISVPVVGRISRKWSIQFTRRLNRSDGSFDGVALVSIDPFYFSRFFDNLDLGDKGTGILVGRDGIVRARRANNNQELGQDLGGSEIFKELEGANAGTYVAKSQIDGIERVFGYASVPDYPLVVGLGIATEQVLAASLQQQRRYLMIGGILTLLIVAFTGLLVRESNRRRRHELETHAQQVLQEQKRQLDIALGNMTQGLLMFDASERIVVCNRRYIEMYGLSEQVVRPGCTVLALLAHRKAVGSLTGDVDRYYRHLKAALARKETATLVIETPSGRSVRVINEPLRDGGWVVTHEDITDQKHTEKTLSDARVKAEQAEREVRAAHARLQEAFDIVPEGLVLFDAEDRHVLWNRRYTELFRETGPFIEMGRRFEDVLRRGLALGQYPDAKGREEAWLAERLARHRKAHSSHEQRLPGGHWIRVEERRTEDGGSIGVRVDITELKQREASFRLLFESNPLPMYVLDDESLAFLAVNDTAVAHYGFSRDQFLAMTFLDIQPFEARKSFAAPLSDLDPARCEGQHHLKSDGTSFQADVYFRAMTYDGRRARFAAVLDVTDRNKAQRMLGESEQMARGIISSALDGFIQMNGSGTITEWNLQAEKIFGWSREDAVGRPLADLILPSQQRGRHKEGFARFLAAEESEPLGKRIEIEAVRKDGRQIKVELSITAQRRQSGFVFNGFVRDLTEKIAAEEQLRQSQKMEAVGNLTGGLAHDFNNLLTVIIGNLDLLLDDQAIGRTAKERLETILQASERGATLTRRLLAFSRRQPLQAKLVEVNDLVQGTTQLLHRTLGENVTIRLRTAPGLWTPRVDAAQLETAIVNIAINARDAMPDGGTLIIETRNVDIDANYAAHCPGLVPGAYVAIEITDTGTGMQPEVLGRIFEPFFTTKGSGAGTGLGLSMVYGFMKQSGGHVTAYSEPGTGTTFKMYLPRADAPESSATMEVRGADMPNSRSFLADKVILTVDDNPVVRATLVSQLKELGYKVIEVSDAASALDQLDKEPKIDLLFTDIVMPGGLNGKELAKKAKAKYPNLRVLFTSGFPGTALSAGAGLEDGDLLLNKPYRKRDLAEMVHRVLAS